MQYILEGGFCSSQFAQELPVCQTRHIRVRPRQIDALVVVGGGEAGHRADGRRRGYRALVGVPDLRRVKSERCVVVPRVGTEAAVDAAVGRGVERAHVIAIAARSA